MLKVFIASAVGITACTLILFYATTGAKSDHKWFLIAHAANAPKLPNNSISGILRNIELGADGIEVDVTLTKDGKFILMHDGTLDRTTNCTGSVAEYTSEEIDADCRLANGEKIPLLQDALIHLIKAYNGLVFIEIKYFSKGNNDRMRYINTILNLLDKYSNEERKRVIITSFDFRLLDMLIQKNKKIKVACEGSYRWAIPRGTINLLSIMGQTPGSLRLRLGDLFKIDAYLYTIRKPSDFSNTVFALLMHKSVKGIMVDDIAIAQKIRTEYFSQKASN